MIQKKWQLAIFSFNSCKDKENSPKFFMNLAECLTQVQQLDSALENLNMAVEEFEKVEERNKSVEYAKCLYSRGEILHKKKCLKVSIFLYLCNYGEV